MRAIDRRDGRTVEVRRVEDDVRGDYYVDGGGTAYEPCELEFLQSVCRGYLGRLRGLADRFGLGGWLSGLVRANSRGECRATEDEVELLARMCGEDRVVRRDIPKMLGKSYRACVEGEDFEQIKRFPHVGIYSRISVLLHGWRNRKRDE